MRSRSIFRVLKFVLFAVLFVAILFLLGFVVKDLWNWLVPAIFGWKAIGYWQAMGLIVLSKILFGGFHRSGGRGGYRPRRMRERWEQMTPEQREKFRQGVRGCWDHAVPPDSSPTS
jgi:hypothetical protein